MTVFYQLDLWISEKWHKLIVHIFKAHVNYEVHKNSQAAIQQKYSEWIDSLGKMYADIHNGEYVFPEFSSLPTEQAKEMSIKAHSCMLRTLRLIQGEQDEDATIESGNAAENNWAAD